MIAVNIPRINIVLDIDGFQVATRTKNNNEVAYYKDMGAIIHATCTHYLHHGMKELNSLLHKTERVRVSIFSGALESRNIPYSDELNRISLEPSKYESTKGKICILSREHLVAPTGEARIEQYEMYGMRTGNQVKDLRQVLEGDDKLENAVLVDDDTSYLFCGQAKNFLHVPDSSPDYKMKNKLKKYNSDGIRMLDCMLIHSDDIKYQKMWVKRGTKIGLVKTTNGFDVCFLDKKTNDYQRKSIPKETHEHLIAMLTEAYNNRPDKECYVQYLENKDLLDEVRKFVTLHGGVASKIHRGLNRIFYATGLLFTALAESKEKNIPITEVLFEMQYQDNSDVSHGEPNFNKSLKRDDLYLFGLEKLREINPDIQLVNPHMYDEIINRQISKEEKEEFERHRAREHKGCTVQ